MPQRSYGRAWSCSCGTDGNWATRASCRGCGRDAPKSVLDRQRDQQRNGTKAPRVAGRSQDNTASEVAALRRELAELKKEKEAAAASASASTSTSSKGTAAGAEPAVDADTAAERDALRESIARLKKDLRHDHPEILEREAKLKDLLEQRPTATRVLSATKKVQRLENRIVDKVKAIAEAEKLVEQAVKDLQTKLEEKAALELELTAAKKEQADALAAAPSTVPQVGQTLRSKYDIIKTWLEVSSASAGEHGQAVGRELLAKLERDLQEELQRDAAEKAARDAQAAASASTAAAAAVATIVAAAAAGSPPSSSSPAPAPPTSPADPASQQQQPQQPQQQHLQQQPQQQQQCDVCMDIDEDALQEIVRMSIEAAADDGAHDAGGDARADQPPLLPRDRLAIVARTVRAKGVARKVITKSKPAPTTPADAKAAVAAAATASLTACG